MKIKKKYQCKKVKLVEKLSTQGETKPQIMYFFIAQDSLQDSLFLIFYRKSTL